MRATGAPLDVLDFSSDAARDIYGYDLLLVRPDLHVVWRGNQPPDDAAAVADRRHRPHLAADPKLLPAEKFIDARASRQPAY